MNEDSSRKDAWNPDKFKGLINYVRRYQTYQDKIVIFYDVLGWKSKVDRAGTDPRAISQLQQLLNLFTTYFQIGEGISDSIKLTSFSDNVVISCSDADIDFVLWATAWAQFMAANAGFFVRGAITRGLIIHDNFIVFGPGLNRAYELEAKVAIYPRIIFDPEYPWDFDSTKFVKKIVCFEDVPFMDVFKLNYAGYIAEVNKNQDEITGLKQVPEGLDSAVGLINEQIRELVRQLSRPLSEQSYDKLIWVYDRILKDLGYPSSARDVYPRVILSG